MSEKEIVLWDNKPKLGVLRIEPLSDEAKENLNAPLLAYIKEFPRFSYGTDWGNWDASNSQWITGKLKTFAGGGDSIPAQIVQMLGGPYYNPPIMTDKWTQLSAQLSDDAYLDFEFELVAYPVIRGGVNGAHVEGLRHDRDNMSEVLSFHGYEMSNFWDWLELGKKCMMPSKFSTKILKDNIDGIVDNMKGDNGRKILNGLGNVAHSADGLFKSDVTLGQSTMRGLRGLNEIVDGVMGVGSRLGSTFCFQVYDDDGKILWNSKAPSLPLDFYIENLSFKFSPHVLNIVNSKGKRVGSCPEYCVIKIKMSSVTKASPEQIQMMHTRGE